MDGRGDTFLCSADPERAWFRAAHQVARALRCAARAAEPGACSPRLPHMALLQEDERLRGLVDEMGRSWVAIAAAMPGRTPKGVSLRFRMYLDPAVRRPQEHPFSEWETAVIVNVRVVQADVHLSLHPQGARSSQARPPSCLHWDPTPPYAQQQRVLGNKWASISKLLPGRSNGDVKNWFLQHVQTGVSKHKKGGAPHTRQCAQRTTGVPVGIAQRRPVLERHGRRDLWCRHAAWLSLQPLARSCTSREPMRASWILAWQTLKRCKMCSCRRRCR